MAESNLEPKSIIQKIASEWHAFQAAFHFLTIIPPIGKSIYDDQEISKSVAYYPIVGFMIGIALWIIDKLLLRIFPSVVASAIVLAVWIAISGALHFDGFLDSCDGLFGGNNPEERLKIMKDERVGAFAVAGGIFLILIKFAALYSLSYYRLQALILSPMIGRWSMSLAVILFPSARQKGLGSNVKKFTEWKQAGISTVITLIGVVLIGRWAGLYIMAASLSVLLLISYFVIKKIKGLTGDSYGAIDEIIEVFVLVIFTGVSNSV